MDLKLFSTNLTTRHKENPFEFIRAKFIRNIAKYICIKYYDSMYYTLHYDNICYRVNVFNNCRNANKIKLER